MIFKYVNMRNCFFSRIDSETQVAGHSYSLRFCLVIRHKIDIMILAAPENVLCQKWIEQMRNLNRHDTQSGATNHIGKPMTVVVHPQETDSRRNSVSANANPRRYIPILAGQQVRAHKRCGGMS